MGIMIQQPQQGGMFGGQPGGMFGGGLQNPNNAALLGFGLNTLQANEEGRGLGGSLLAGAGGGLGSYMGAQGMQEQALKDDERRQMMQKLIARMGGVADRSGMAGGIGGQGGIFPPQEGPNPNAVLGGMFPQQQQPQGIGGVGGFY